MKRVPALGGLRGIAILLVLLVHGTGVKGGLLGVDLFFVLSGYLITSILLREWETTAAVSLRRFYVRRAVRLMPALALVVAVSTVVGVAVGAPIGRELGYAATSLTYTTNLVFIADHHAVAPQFNPQWSLAIEEQFYIVWPILLILGLRYARRWLPWIVGAVAALSIMDVFFVARPSWVYTGPDTRANELLVGCLVAIVADRGLRVRGWIAVVGFLMAAWSFAEVTIWDDASWPTFAAGCALVVSWAAHAEGGAAVAALSFRPLVFLGTISYGLYLWHAVLLATGLPFVLAYPVALVIAVQSWRLLERPLLRRYGHAAKPQDHAAALNRALIPPLAAPFGSSTGRIASDAVAPLGLEVVAAENAAVPALPLTAAIASATASSMLP